MTRDEKIKQLEILNMKMQTPYIALLPNVRKNLWVYGFHEVVLNFNGKDIDGFKLLVNMEDGESVDKYFESTSKKLWEQISPIFEKYADKDVIGLSIKKKGAGNETIYDVEELDD